jgi:hypothetical protein
MSDVPLFLSFSVPEPCGDEVNERRRAHADLAAMPAWELEAEGHRARLALCFGAFRNMFERAWTRERLEACQAEARRRKAVRA